MPASTWRRRSRSSPAPARCWPTEVERALDAEPRLRAEVEPARAAALDALDGHVRWLEDRLPAAAGEPRLGPEAFARKLALALDTGSTPDALLARAETDLALVEERIAETAGRIAGEDPRTEGLVRRVLDRLAAEGAVDDDTIVGQCYAALESSTAFVRAADLVTVHDDPVEIIVMPEIHRGVAVAYCDPPGPLESRPLPTYFAVLAHTGRVAG
jgi:hypothetical protein